MKSWSIYPKKVADIEKRNSYDGFVEQGIVLKEKFYAAVDTNPSPADLFNEVDELDEGWE